MSDKDKKKKKKKLLEQQEDYASAASGERSFFGKFSPTAFITRGISNLIADDEDDLKSIRAKSKKKNRLELDTGLPGMAAPFADNKIIKKRAGGRIKARGVGVAKRGYGKGPYSNQLI